MKIDWYKVTLEVISTSVLAGAGVLSFVAVGMVARGVYELMHLGLTGFGYWPL